MQKWTHLLFAGLLFAALNFALKLPLYMAVFAALGALLPDLDMWPRAAHRRLCHNLWFLLAVLLVGFKFFQLQLAAAIALAIGFVSHMLMDSLTVRGLSPLWPLPWKIRGPLRTAGLAEYLIASCMLLCILMLFGVISITLRL